jgi:hypothetical protein
MAAAGSISQKQTRSSAATALGDFCQLRLKLSGDDERSRRMEKAASSPYYYIAGPAL